MTRKTDEDSKNQNDDEPGFQINLPFGFGWVRGDGSHVAILMPAVKWLLIAATALYLLLRIVQEWKAT